MGKKKVTAKKFQSHNLFSTLLFLDDFQQIIMVKTYQSI